MQLQSHSQPSSSFLEAQKIPRTWVIVADEKSAHIYCKTVNRLAVILDEENETFTTGSRNAGLSSEAIHYCGKADKKSRMPTSSFVYKLGELLDKGEKDRIFDHLIVIAPSTMLNQMRLHFSTSVQQRIIAELDKNLTCLSEEKLYNYLENIIWF